MGPFVATTGRVLVNVDATNGPIHIGDLLVTSDIPGGAMKSEPITIGNRKMHMLGTLIGKALEPLEKGSGKILALLSPQYFFNENTDANEANFNVNEPTKNRCATLT